MSLSDENAELKAARTDQDNKDITQGASLNFLGFIIRLGSRLPFLIIAVALFGSELYGRYNYTITTVEICAAFATFKNLVSWFSPRARVDSIARIDIKVSI